MKYTQGPWKVNRAYNESNEKVVTVESEDREICTIHKYWIEREANANARLISAAPELLNTLRSLALSMRAHPDNLPNSEFEDLVYRAFEVIEKATGK